MTTPYEPYVLLQELRPARAQARLDYFRKLHRGLSADLAVRRVIGRAPEDDVRDAFLAIARANIQLARAQLALSQDSTSDPQSPSTP